MTTVMTLASTLIEMPWKINLKFASFSLFAAVSAHRPLVDSALFSNSLSKIKRRANIVRQIAVNGIQGLLKLISMIQKRSVIDRMSSIIIIDDSHVHTQKKRSKKKWTHILFGLFTRAPSSHRDNYFTSSNPLRSVRAHRRHMKNVDVNVSVAVEVIRFGFGGDWSGYLLLRSFFLRPHSNDINLVFNGDENATSSYSFHRK